MNRPSRRRRILVVALLLLILVAAVVIGFQGRLIYYGQPYPASTLANIPPGVEVLRYHTGQGRQVSFYQAPSNGGEPRQIWLLCNGQGNLALEWPALLKQVNVNAPHAGWLFFDYPGYGFCEGRSSPGNILESSAGVVEALRGRLGLTSSQMNDRLGVFGYSLGTAIALQYAARYPVRRIVLAAPFTSLVDMGNRIYFWPCGQLIWHRFDNAARLAEIARQSPRPTVRIAHGDLDEAIPLKMSSDLAAANAGWIDLRIVPKADHNDIVFSALQMLSMP